MRLLTALLLLLALLPGLAAAETLRVGTWKTAQTIQPFFYQEFLPVSLTAEVFAFTNPVDQKTALLAGSLDLAGTTLAHAIQSAVLGQPVVLVAALCHKSSALVVDRDGPIRAIVDLRGRRVGYAPGTMHEILLRETLHRADLDAAIAAHSRNWKLARIGQVELTLLRMAAFELKHLPDVPPRAIINEALELNREFGDAASHGFINGVLDALAAEPRA